MLRRFRPTHITCSARNATKIINVTKIAGLAKKTESKDDSEATHEEEHANSCGCPPPDAQLHSAASAAQCKSTVTLTFERLDIEREKYGRDLDH
jgi:hypothetical protein